MKENKDFGGAIFLIFLGVLFLLNTTGIVGWGIWTFIFDYWPVLLVLWGIKLIIGDSLISSIVMGVVSLIVYGSIMLLAYVGFTQKNVPFLSDSVNEHINRPFFQTFNGDYIEEESTIKGDEFQDLQNRNIDINVGASEFTLDDNKDSADYLSLKSKYVENHIEPELVYSKNDNDLNISFTTQSPRNIFVFRNISTTFNLTLGKVDLATDLDVDLGAGAGKISLENVLLNSVNARVGAGDLELSLLNRSVPKKMTLDIGAANLDLTIPKETAYSLKYNLGVGDISINNESIASFISENDSYKSSNYEGASNPLEITVKVGAGSLNIFTK